MQKEYILLLWLHEPLTGLLKFGFEPGKGVHIMCLAMSQMDTVQWRFEYVHYITLTSYTRTHPGNELEVEQGSSKDPLLWPLSDLQLLVWPLLDL